MTLVIHHNIYLNKEDRYSLHQGMPVESIGVSLPVWYDFGITSEPAKEVFCRYYLINNGEQIPIKVFEDGYEIVLPSKLYKKKASLEEEKEDFDQGGVTSSKGLLNFADGGARSMMYREHNKVKINGKMLNMIHYVNISAEENLLNSLTVVNSQLMTFPI